MLTRLDCGSRISSCASMTRLPRPLPTTRPTASLWAVEASSILASTGELSHPSIPYHSVSFSYCSWSWSSSLSGSFTTTLCIPSTEDHLSQLSGLTTQERFLMPLLKVIYLFKKFTNHKRPREKWKKYDKFS